jgi:hypothetical protein
LVSIAGISCVGSGGVKTTHSRYQDVRMVVIVGVTGKVSVGGRNTHGVGGLSLERSIGDLSGNSKLRIADLAR